MKILKAIWAFILIPFLLVVTGLTWLFFSRDPEKENDDPDLT